MIKLVFIFCFLAHYHIYSALGCMDKSKHAFYGYKMNDVSCHPLDEKTLYYVKCSCRCWEHLRDPQYGRCVVCWHFGEPINPSIANRAFEDYVQRISNYAHHVINQD